EIFDVREQEELKAGTIPNAIHLPLSIILNNEGDFSEILKYKSSYKKICIYCQHGFRGIQAITKLSTFGIENLHNLTGGYLSWCSTLLNK
ncbi:MAG: rhodanese-like domain-containing protein, partial [Francisellaceae bacterium]|nr:rhodanese-like domain-containing protein [Francisellaceae bacterium]